jgi:hypothetical protein
MGPDRQKHCQAAAMAFWSVVSVGIEVAVAGLKPETSFANDQFSPFEQWKRDNAH